MSQPLVSIIVPVYNTECYLEKCLDSILNQSYKNLEIIAVNDGSIDSSLSILESYKKKDCRVNVLSQSNQGHQKSRQVGISKTRGLYILFVDSDDSLEPKAIELMVNCAQKTNVDIVTSRINIETANYKKTFPSSVFSTITAKEYLEKYLLFGRVGWNICSKLFKSDIIKANMLDAPITVTAGEDALFMILLVSKMKGKVSMLNIPTYNYYFHSNSITHSKNPKYIFDNFKVADYIDYTLANDVKQESLVAFRLLCMSNSFRYGWLGSEHILNKKAIDGYKKNRRIITKFSYKKQLQLLLLIYLGNYISKYFFKNNITDEN